MDVKLMKAHCPFAKKYFLISVENGKATDFIPVSKDKYDKVSTTQVVKETAKNLLPCQYEQTRTIASSNRTKDTLCPGCKNKEYNFQCIYCSNLEVEGVGGKGKSLEECKILVSTPHYDNIGSLLTTMRLNHSTYARNLAGTDILFLNCGTTDVVNAYELKQFVNEGGILYASDWAVTYIKEAFPDFITSYDKNTNSCHMECEIVDYEMQQVSRSVKVFFDLSAWVEILSQTGTVLMKEKGGLGRPVMVMKKYGKGVVFFTSFHNYELASTQEQQLLKLFICKQLAAKTGKSVMDISALLGLNFKI